MEFLKEVIGPNSFIVAFVNDVPDTVSSKVYMCADDTKMYKGIHDINDHRQLQMDINKLDSFSVERQALAVRLDLCFRSVYFFIREYLPNC